MKTKLKYSLTPSLKVLTGTKLGPEFVELKRLKDEEKLNEENVFEGCFLYI